MPRRKEEVNRAIAIRQWGGPPGPRPVPGRPPLIAPFNLIQFELGFSAASTTNVDTGTFSAFICRPSCWRNSLLCLPEK